jgi:ubiquinone/menaquinone biosynthesis C-methylase UbiE
MPVGAMKDGMDSTFAAYDEVADAYHEAVAANGSTLRDPVLEDLLDDVSGRRVLAVACGQGREARRLADLGAQVVAVDASARLLAYARELEQREPRGITYLQGDARDLRALGNDSFDAVVCHMALMDIPDLEQVVAAIGRVLRTGGWFVFSIVHPCYKTPADGELVDHVDGSVRRTVGKYFVEGPYDSVTRWAALPRRAYHRTLSTYLNTLASQGLCLTRLVEPVGDRAIWQEVPGTLYAHCRKLRPAGEGARP